MSIRHPRRECRRDARPLRGFYTSRVASGSPLKTPLKTPRQFAAVRRPAAHARAPAAGVRRRHAGAETPAAHPAPSRHRAARGSTAVPALSQRRAAEHAGSVRDGPRRRRGSAGRLRHWHRAATQTASPSPELIVASAFRCCGDRAAPRRCRGRWRRRRRRRAPSARCGAHNPPARSAARN